MFLSTYGSIALYWMVFVVLKLFFLLWSNGAALIFLRKKISVVEQRSSLEEVENREIQYKLYSLRLLMKLNSLMRMLNAFCMKRLIVYLNNVASIFIESKLNNKKYQDIADEMGLSLQTVKNQVMIAVRKLREDLKDYLPLLVFLLG